MKQYTKPQKQYVDISLDGNVTISFLKSRFLLAQMGIPGEILPTPGHSDDSVSLLLDGGSVFTGDLPGGTCLGGGRRAGECKLAIAKAESFQTRLSCSWGNPVG